MGAHSWSYVGLKVTVCWVGSRGLVRVRVDTVRASMVSSTFGAADLEGREIWGGEESGEEGLEVDGLLGLGFSCWSSSSSMSVSL